jgi:hypothetical protein
MEPDEPTEPSILLDAYALVHGDRNGTYGPPAQDYTRTAAIFAAVTGYEMSVAEALLFMVAMKMSRIGYGLEQEFPAEMLRDSITDAAGYLDCLWWSLVEPDLDDDDSDDDEELDE